VNSYSLIWRCLVSDPVPGNVPDELRHAVADIFIDAMSHGGWPEAEQYADEVLAVVLPVVRQRAQTADEPQLGFATTRQLLEELRVRVEIDYYAGGGGLDYTTVHGRPDGKNLD
jgi:hypothetical protein